jgi:FAD/FMN-containing dehydrogenase
MTVAHLREELTGEVIEPGSPGYEQARKPAISRHQDIRPLAVVRGASPDDVARTLAFAQRTGVHVVPRGGGHCFAGRSSTDGIVLDLTPMRSVSVSADGTATIGAGAKLAEVYDALDEHGLTIPAGCGPGVGIAGLTLGGGLGILGRKYGLTCDRLLSAEVVLADGRVVHCDEQHEPDLFWALRGAGGGQFGVVTSLVFDTVPAPRANRFQFTWPVTAAARVLAAWQEWAPDAPDEVSAGLRITNEQAVLAGATLGRPDAVAGLIRLTSPAPASADWAEQPYRELKQSLDEIRPGPVVGKSEFFGRPLPTDVLAELLGTLEPGGELTFTPMGGAYNRVPADATAFAHRAERFLIEHAGPDQDWVRRSWSLLRPHASGRVYPNFPDPELTGWAEAYHGDNLERLKQVKRQYDPERLFRFPQSL